MCSHFRLKQEIVRKLTILGEVLISVLLTILSFQILLLNQDVNTLFDDRHFRLESETHTLKMTFQ